VVFGRTSHGNDVPLATIEVTDPALPGVLLAGSRCCSCRERQQAWFLNLLSYHRFCCLSRRSEVAAPPVVSHTHQLGGDLVARGGIDRRNG
jgi:hypothetical protein